MFLRYHTPILRIAIENAAQQRSNAEANFKALLSNTVCTTAS